MQKMSSNKSDPVGATPGQLLPPAYLLPEDHPHQGKILHKISKLTKRCLACLLDATTASQLMSST